MTHDFVDFVDFVSLTLILHFNVEAVLGFEI